MTTQATGGALDEAELERHRRELTGYCYRMLGSGFDAEDAVQETMIRAWRRAETYEGRASVRSWLYRIATNVCLDQIEGRKRRATPVDLEDPSRPLGELLRPPLPETTWILPTPESAVLPDPSDPAVLAEARETVQLAFVAALQHLPARQRAVLILREVLRLSAAEVADLIDASVPTVTSLLQRARATLARVQADHAAREGTFADLASLDAEAEALLDRYLAAFEAYDIDAFTALLHEEATQTMPPFSLWLRGPADIGAWMVGPGAGCVGSRLVPLRGNGLPGFAQYRRTAEGAYEPWGIVLLEIAAGRVTGLRYFLAMTDPRLFPHFGLPETLT